MKIITSTNETNTTSKHKPMIRTKQMCGAGLLSATVLTSAAGPLGFGSHGPSLLPILNGAPVVIIQAGKEDNKGDTKNPSNSSSRAPELTQFNFSHNPPHVGAGIQQQINKDTAVRVGAGGNFDNYANGSVGVSQRVGPAMLHIDGQADISKNLGVSAGVTAPFGGNKPK